MAAKLGEFLKRVPIKFVTKRFTGLYSFSCTLIFKAAFNAKFFILEFLN